MAVKRRIATMLPLLLMLIAGSAPVIYYNTRPTGTTFRPPPPGAEPPSETVLRCTDDGYLAPRIDVPGSEFRFRDDAYAVVPAPGRGVERANCSIGYTFRLARNTDAQLVYYMDALGRGMKVWLDGRGYLSMRRYFGSIAPPFSSSLHGHRFEGLFYVEIGFSNPHRFYVSGNDKRMEFHLPTSEYAIDVPFVYVGGYCVDGGFASMAGQILEAMYVGDNATTRYDRFDFMERRVKK